MAIVDGLVGAIGNTPLIRLRGASELTGCEILGKAEFLNPGGSVKDRAGLYLILDAEKRSILNPGGLIVEGTAGNTGIGLALVGNARGYSTLIVIPETQSQEKKDMLPCAAPSCAKCRRCRTRIPIITSTFPSAWRRSSAASGRTSGTTPRTPTVT